VPGFCKSAPLDEVRKHGHVLTPGRYVGAEAQEDDGEPFEEKMKRLTATLREQQAEAAKLPRCRLRELGYAGDAPFSEATIRKDVVTPDPRSLETIIAGGETLSSSEERAALNEPTWS
jgi:hypothetical protein